MQEMKKNLSDYPIVGNFNRHQIPAQRKVAIGGTVYLAVARGQRNDCFGCQLKVNSFECRSLDCSEVTYRIED